MTQPPGEQGAQPLPPLQPFVLPGPAPTGGPPDGNSYGQPYPAYPQSQAGPPWQQRDPALAEWWRRLLARVIDGLAVTLLASPMWAAALLPLWHRLLEAAHAQYLGPAAQQAYVSSFNRQFAAMAGTFLLIGIATAVIKFGYDWLQHGLWGQTLGKRALGTKVVMAGSRTRVTGRAAGARAAVYALAGGVPYAGFFWWVLDCLWLTWDPQRQCLHDKAARTVVVKKAMLS